MDEVVNEECNELKAAAVSYSRDVGMLEQCVLQEGRKVNFHKAQWSEKSS